MNTTLPAGLPIPTFNLITRQTVSDPGYWEKVLRYPATLTSVVLTPANATTLAQLQSLSATVLGGTSGTQVLGQLQAGYTNNQFSYSLQWSGSSWIVQELGWTFQMPSTCDHFSWNRAGSWTVYPTTDIGRAAGTATPDSTNADYTRMDLTNAFDFNSTKYNCNWASLATAAGDGLLVEFSPQQPFHCRAGAASSGQGYVLYRKPAGQPVRMTIPRSGSRLDYDALAPGTSFRAVLASVLWPASVNTSSNAICERHGHGRGFFAASAGGKQFGLAFNGLTNTSYSVWASTNLVNWRWEGTAAEKSLGEYQFFDPTSTNALYRFYRISAP